MSRTSLFSQAALLAAAFCGAAACQPASARPLVDIAVIDREHGHWLEETAHRGQYWIAGTPGHRYGVRLTNTSGQRVLVVLSVDGVNAVSGETAHPAQAGYVLEPWQSTQISGWRKSYQDVAQFVFTDLPDSYAARTGRPDHVGVIGIAVFQEARTIHHPSYPTQAPIASSGHERSANKAASPPSAAAESRAYGEATAHDEAAQGLGTGHGEREWSPVSRTGFVRASRRPAQVSELHYDDHASLVARGVLPRHPYYRDDDRPHAFPNGFVADPPPRW
ncbi:hypothetical protein ACFQZQ_06465 [Lysobacter koreensis]|uniref:Uncharacterized protein n=1 Tax=Lysobacter koreensis TaxID=266122 RepID=A0ABW2YQ44_9GAMM